MIVGTCHAPKIEACEREEKGKKTTLELCTTWKRLWKPSKYIYIYIYIYFKHMYEQGLLRQILWKEEILETKSKGLWRSMQLHQINNKDMAIRTHALIKTKWKFKNKNFNSKTLFIDQKIPRKVPHFFLIHNLRIMWGTLGFN